MSLSLTLTSLYLLFGSLDHESSLSLESVCVGNSIWLHFIISSSILSTSSSFSSSVISFTISFSKGLPLLVSSFLRRSSKFELPLLLLISSSSFAFICNVSSCESVLVPSSGSSSYVVERRCFDGSAYEEVTARATTTRPVYTFICLSFWGVSKFEYEQQWVRMLDFRASSGFAFWANKSRARPSQDCSSLYISRYYFCRCKAPHLLRWRLLAQSTHTLHLKKENWFLWTHQSVRNNPTLCTLHCDLTFLLLTHFISIMMITILCRLHGLNRM